MSQGKIEQKNMFMECIPMRQIFECYQECSGGWIDSR